MGLGSRGRSGYGEGAIESSRPSGWGVRRNQPRRPRSPQCAQRLPRQTGRPGEDRALAAAVGGTQTVLSLAAARDQANEEYKATAKQAVSVRQQAAVRAGFSALPFKKRDAPGYCQDFPQLSGGLAHASDAVGRVQGGVAVDLLCVRLCCCLSGSF